MSVAVASALLRWPKDCRKEFNGATGNKADNSMRNKTNKKIPIRGIKL